MYSANEGSHGTRLYDARLYVTAQEWARQFSFALVEVWKQGCLINKDKTVKSEGSMRFTAQIPSGWTSARRRAACAVRPVRCLALLVLIIVGVKSDGRAYI